MCLEEQSKSGTVMGRPSNCVVKHNVAFYSLVQE